MTASAQYEMIKPVMQKKLLVILPLITLFLSGCLAPSQMVVSPSPEPSLVPTPEPGVLVGGAILTETRAMAENLSRSADHRTLSQALQTAQLVEALQGAGPFTVFAPTDQAFQKLPAGMMDSLLLPDRQTDLRSILTFHVVPGVYSQADFKDGMSLTTVQGQTILLRRTQDRWTINGAGITIPDVRTANGMLFVTDTVMVPQLARPTPSLVPPSL